MGDIEEIVQKNDWENKEKCSIVIENNKKIKTIYDDKYRSGDFLAPTVMEFILITFESGIYTPLAMSIIGSQYNVIPAEIFLPIVFAPQIVTYTVGRTIEVFSKENFKKKLKKDKITKLEERPIYQEITDLKTNKTRKENWIYLP